MTKNYNSKKSMTSTIKSQDCKVIEVKKEKRLETKKKSKNEINKLHRDFNHMMQIIERIVDMFMQFSDNSLELADQVYYNARRLGHIIDENNLKDLPEIDKPKKYNNGDHYLN